MTTEARHLTAICGCGNPMTRDRGRCLTCWQAQRKARAAESLPERFERFVVRADGCWGWSGAINQGGYPTIHVQGARGHRVAKAHRVSWTLFRGDIPDGLHVLHSCDNRVCTNPDHLWLGTNADNVADREAKGRMVNPSGWVRATPEYIAAIKRQALEESPEWRDGEALRLLREALPSGCWVNVSSIGPRWHLTLWNLDPELLPDIDHVADTIAAAADAAREALR
jgi:hypothetical protein